MASELVGAFRALIAHREATGGKVTVLERAQVLAILARPTVGGQDVIDELEAAIAHARRVLNPALPPHELAAITRLLMAARAVIDYSPLMVDPVDHTHPPAAPPELRTPARADVDG